MKKRNRILSGLLTAAMLATTVWGGYSVTSYAAETDGQIEAGGPAPLAEAGTRLISWSAPLTDDGEISPDGNSFEREPYTFQDASWNVSGISGESEWLDFTDWSEKARSKVLEAFGIEDEDASIYSPGYSYQWYRQNEGEEPELLENEDELQLGNDYTVRASEGTVKFILRITLDSVDIYFEGEEGDEVFYFEDLGGAYEYSIDDIFTYQYDGSQEMAPVTVYTQDQEVDARTNAKKTFVVNAAKNKPSVEAVLYQWYSVKDAKDTLLEGETTDTLKAKITDSSVSYKCRITPQWEEGYAGEDAAWEKFVTFTVKTVPGYRVLDRANNYTYLDLNETAELYVNAEVDDAYALTYKWEKGSQNPDTYESEWSAVEGQTGSRLEVTPKADSDFNFDSNYCRYRLTIGIEQKSDKKPVDAAGEDTVFDFYICKNYDDGYRVEKSEETQDVHYGDPAEVYVKPTVNENYTVKNTWYETIARERYYEEYDPVSGSYKKVFENKDFQEPTGEDIRMEWEYDEYTGGHQWRTAYYLKKLSAPAGVTISADGTTLSVASLEKNISYGCITEVSRKDALENDGVRSYNSFFSLNVCTELSAFAKNDNVTGSIGKAASLEVVAQNFDSARKKISYVWKKYNAEKRTYEAIANAASAEYKIDSVKESDFGRYRAEVSDGVETVFVDVNLVKEDLKTVIYTPKRSSFKKAIGDNVNLIADIEFSQSDKKVFYEWYKLEDEYDEDGWEILNQDSKEYAFKLENESQYGTYKCIATYHDKNVSISATFIYDVDPAYSFTYERLTPQTQYKRIGDSITYAVRAVTDNPKITEDKIKYQWYSGSPSYYDHTEGTEIKGAAGASYTVDKLTADNFGPVYCKITVEDEQNNTNEETRARFTTRFISDAYFETSGEEIEAEPGTDVKLSPVLVNAGNAAFTYQWYRTNEYDETEKIFGAVSKDYTISKIGENEFGRYSCEVFQDGMPVDEYTAEVIKKTEPSILTAEPAEGIDQYISAVLGNSVKMAVTAKSDKNLKLKYQWYFKSTAIGGATAASYEIAQLTPSRTGSYECVVKDEAGATAEVRFYVSSTTNLQTETNSWDNSGTIGYEASFGKPVTLKATATVDPKYQIFYEWYKGSLEGEHRRIRGQNTAQLAIPNVTEDDLGDYYCMVYNDQETKYIDYSVYVNTGLVVEPSCHDVLAASNGSVKMSADARANTGEKISWKWFKWDEGTEEDESAGKYVEIAGADKAVYTIPKLLKAHYGYYKCTVSTRGESLDYYYALQPGYTVDANREYAEKGDMITSTVTVTNPAGDAKYSYQWYAYNLVTENYMKASATGTTYTAAAPAVKAEDLHGLGYATARYRCVVKDGEDIVANTGYDIDDEEYVRGYAETYVNILPIVSYSQSLPETSHPNDKRYSIKGYRNSGAKQLQITFDSRTDTDVTIIDKNGHAQIHVLGSMRQLTYTVDGDSFIVLAGNNYDGYDGSSVSKAYGYGYKVTSVKRIGDPVKPNTNNNSSQKAVPKKGAKYTTGNVTYKVTKSAAKNGTVEVSGVKKKSLTSASIKSTVKIDGYTFKVTAVGAKAFKGCAKMKKVTVSKNVTSIGKSAFEGCKKLKTITIKSAGVKKVGAKAFKGIQKSAKIKVPSKKLSAYKKLFKGKGQDKKVKITK